MMLHVYGQGSFRDEAGIVGNRAGLSALRDALTTALDSENGRASMEAMVKDGEGFNVLVVCDNSPWTGPGWQRRAVPYTEEYAQESHADARYPWQSDGT
ncbi:MAG: hypothetical protein ACYDAG_05695 [Chloroflexota bacterium]